MSLPLSTLPPFFDPTEMGQSKSDFFKRTFDFFPQMIENKIKPTLLSYSVVLHSIFSLHIPYIPKTVIRGTLKLQFLIIMASQPGKSKS